MGDPLLDHLRAAGQPDSTGRFTLDPEKAREKLARFALADPERYVVHLVESACLAEATGIRIQRQGHGCRVEFDGRPFRAEDLRSLLPGLLQGRWALDDPLQPLALAVNGVLHGLAASVTLDSGTARVTWTRAGVHQAERPPGPTSIRVLRRPRSLLERLVPRGRELDQLLVHCAHCPVPLEVFGRTLNGPLVLRDALVLSELHHDQHPLPEVATPASVHMLGRASPGHFSAVLALGSSTLPAGLRVQTMGRLYAMPSLLPAGVSAIVRTRAMRTDLGRNHLVSDPAYDDMLRWLRDEGERMRRLLAREALTLPLAGQRRAAPHLNHLAWELHRAGNHPAAAEALRPVARCAARTTANDEALRYRLALLEYRAGRMLDGVEPAWVSLEAWGESVGVRVSRPNMEVGGPFPFVPMTGLVPQLYRFQTWLLEIESGVLGPNHPNTVVRRAALRDLCARHALEEPDESTFRDPWHTSELGGFPPPAEAP